MFTARIAPIAIAAFLLAAASPAIADVKAGVDAWSKGDFQTAIRQWRDPAAKGDPDAQFNLAQAYKLGRGVKQDLNIAADWYQRAGAQGHLQARDSLGHLFHYQGKIAEALPYLEESAKRGEPRSQYLLATELFNGVHAPKDWVRAYALMMRASSAGLSPASRSLAEMDKYIPLDQRQKGAAMAVEIERNSAQVRAAQVSGIPINTSPPPAVARRVDVPPSQAKGEPGFPGAIPPIDGKVEPMVPAKAATPVASQPQLASPAPVPTTSGKWRIQLGAFASEANASRLWKSLQSEVSGLAALSSYMVGTGSLTRLQAGPFANRAEAVAMCDQVKAASPGQACITVAP